MRVIKSLLYKLQSAILRILIAFSFLLIVANFGYIIYYQFLNYDLCKVIVGFISLCVMIHTNKSIGG